MTSLWLKVEIQAGTDIATACKGAALLAEKLSIGVQFSFNGTICYARPGDRPEDIEYQWDDKRRREDYERTQ
jgi:hypothetical protein